MRKTTNYGLRLYDLDDNYDITAEENSLNANMKIIDKTLGEKANISDILTKTSELENDSKFVNETYVANKIAEAELSGGDVDLSGLATKDDLNTKVDKVTGKSLIADTEIERLKNVTNYDDTEIKNQIKSKADKSELHNHNNKDILDNITSENINKWNNKSEFDGNYDSLSNKPTIPNKVSELENDKNYLTSVPSEYKTKTENDSLYQAKGNYLTGFTETDPTVPSHVKNISENDISNWNNKSNFSGSYNDLTNKPTLFSGSYNDLTNKPTIPTKTSQLTNDNNYLTSVPNEYATKTYVEEIIDEATGSLIVDEIPAYVKEEAERCARVVQGHQNENTMTAILSSDYHLPNKSHAYYSRILAGITHAGQAMGILRKQISRDFEAKLGDIVWDSGETIEEALETYRLVHSLVSERGSTDEFEANGNHDHLQSNTTRFTDSQVFANLGIYNKGAVFDETNRKGGYCYRDYKDFYIRVILLNTSEVDDGSFSLSSKQIAWLQKALEVDTAEGWGTLILSHHPLDWGGSSTQVMNVIKSASGVICNIHGHVHTYTQDVITGTTIPRLAIPNVCFERTNEYGENGKTDNAEGIEFGTTESYEKKMDTAEDTSFCVMSIDRVAGKLYLDHYGAGIDREVDIPKITRISYTNMVKLSQEVGSTAIYNAPYGYKDGYYASGANESPKDGFVLTGLIPYGTKRKDPLYIKGATLDTSLSHCRILSFNAAKQASFQSAAGTAITTYYSVETLGTDYYKVTPISDEAVANADYLRISLYGTGENLIITIDEPIA